MMDIQEIDVHSLQQWIQERKSIRLIDVRSPNEVAQGMIPNGEVLPLHLLPLQKDHMDPDHSYVFYCRSGARSAQACAFLKQFQFENVINLRGGIMEWVRSGLPLSLAAEGVA